MGKLTTKEKCIWTVSAVFLLAAIFYAFVRLFIQGDFSWEFSHSEFWSMMAELTVLFLLFFGAGTLIRDTRKKLAAMGLAAAVFLWIHVILIPLAVSGIYLLYLCMAGRTIRRLLKKGRWAETETPSLLRQYRKEMLAFTSDDPVLEWGRDFLTGALAVICLFCLMSAAGIGSIPMMCAAVLLSAGVLLVREYICLYRRPVLTDKKETVKTDGRWPAAFSLGVAFLLTMFCLQAGRMNIAVDYDSFWYGVRSAYILNNGRGIYENLGTVNVVYTYSKGWETLTLPLVLLPSYSFQISFNLWLTAGALLMAYRVAGYFLNRKMAAYLTVFLSSIPGITNMSVTAKTDTVTLFLQLIMIRELLVCLTGGSMRPDSREGTVPGKRTADGAIYYSVAALAFSWMCKPTSLVFSTAVYGMGFLGLLWMRRFSLRCRRENWLEAAGITVLALGGLIGIWGRTWLLTGLPVTSVFSSFLKRLGFRMKYPFDTQSAVSWLDDLHGPDLLRHIAGRLYGLILDPSELSHVLIAWGSLIFLLAVLAAAAWCLLKRREESPAERKPKQWFYIVYFPFLIVNLISLICLYQVDGNYFMLLYVLTGIFSFCLIARLAGQAVRRAYALLALPVIVFSAVLTVVSDWGWSAGLSPVNVINRGYYDHLELRHAEMAGEGKGEIWNILAEDPRNRLIVFGSHPEDLLFPCSVQSITDIIGSGGNLSLAEEKNGFSEFLRYAGTDYIYLKGSWIGDRTWLWPMLYDTIEAGYLRPVLYTEDNMLAEVCVDDPAAGDAKKLAEEFLAWEEVWAGPAE